MHKNIHKAELILSSCHDGNRSGIFIQSVARRRESIFVWAEETNAVFCTIGKQIELVITLSVAESQIDGPGILFSVIEISKVWNCFFSKQAYCC